MRVSLPMYDLAELRPATDAWWQGVAQALARLGVAEVPRELDRVQPPELGWRADDLLLSQCCGRDLVTHLAGVVVPVAIPTYRAPGCGPGTYRSWLVGRRGDGRSRLHDFVGATAAVNYVGSHSGWVALGHSLAQAGLPEGCLEVGLLTGSHRASLRAVAHGDADLAAIDCVTFALLARVEPKLIAGVRIVGESEPAPALPYITAAGQGDATRQQLTLTLLAAATEHGLRAARDALLIDGFLVPGEHAYSRTVALAAAALRSPCRVLR
jgi:ABC-type phosphate/phosphonate transport system substrate-binding protein